MSAADRQNFDMSRPVRLNWEFGSAEVQSLGGMLGPVTFRLGDERELEIMHVAPWAGTTNAAGLPGLLRRMRGEWPCLPFGRSDTPVGLPPGWNAKTADDSWDHGYAAHHRWTCLEADSESVRLGIDYPAASPIVRMERLIRVEPHSPALNISLSVWSRRPARLPIGLHPTFRLPAMPGRVKVMLGRHDGVYSYPTGVPGAVSRLIPDQRSASLAALAGIDGPFDLEHLPVAMPTEELMQVRAIAAGHESKADNAPFALHYLDYDACVGMWWDTAQLPDLMLWISNGGRINYPWMSRHLAIGAEPINSLFDLGRVATAPAGHPLADRLGVALSPDQPWQTSYRIAAWPRVA
jgi:hypothetical protein